MTAQHPMFDLSGQVAIVTGGADGLGLGIAKILAGCGALIAIGDLNLEGAQQAARDLVANGGRAAAYALDQGNQASIETFVAAVRKEHGRIDVLVNNAGYQHRALFDETDAALWDRMFAVNLRGPFLLMREVARVMKRDATRGRIVNISSLGSMITMDTGLTAYSAVKSGVNGLTRNAALELGADGITVNAVLPGGVPTRGALTAVGPPPSAKLLARFPPPLGRMATPEDIGGAVLFFASGAASFITGQLLIVDGGFSIV